MPLADCQSKRLHQIKDPSFGNPLPRPSTFLTHWQELTEFYCREKKHEHGAEEPIGTLQKLKNINAAGRLSFNTSHYAKGSIFYVIHHSAVSHSFNNAFLHTLLALSIESTHYGAEAIHILQELGQSKCNWPIVNRQFTPCKKILVSTFVPHWHEIAT